MLLKNWKQVLLVGLIGVAQLQGQSTFDQLKTDRWTDHVLFFSTLFKYAKINSFLEFGLGAGTQFFLENCGQVTSVELITEPVASGKAWFEKCRSMYDGVSNWTGILYVCGPAAAEITRLGHLGKNELPLDAETMAEVTKVTNRFVPTKDQYDLIFVDCGILFRSDLTNQMFGKSDIVVAHDTGDAYFTYGWNRLEHPAEYCMFKTTDNRTTAWIKKSRAELIIAMTAESYMINLG